MADLIGAAGTIKDEDELSIPRAALNKMIKETLPNIRVANESRELILTCCSEFIHFIASEANDICNKDQRKTISADHVLQALENLGFGSYKDDVMAILEQTKEVAAKKRRKGTRLENLGIPEDELLRQQQELFAKARQEQEDIRQQQWLQLQAAMQQTRPTFNMPSPKNSDDDYD